MELIKIFVFCSSPFLFSSISACQVQLPALRFLAVLCYQNEGVASTVGATQHEDPLTGEQRPLPQILVELLRRDQPIEIQLTLAKCLTNLCKANAIEPWDSSIVYLALPTLG